MVCFMSQRAETLRRDLKNELRQLGFPLPSTSPPDTGAASAVKPKAKPQPPVDAAPRAPFAIELWSGTAGLTAEIRKQGIDHVVKAGCKAPPSASLMSPSPRFKHASNHGSKIRRVSTCIAVSHVEHPEEQEKYGFKAPALNLFEPKICRKAFQTFP